MSSFLSSPLKFPQNSPLFSPKPRQFPITFAISTAERKGRRRKQSRDDDPSSSSSSNGAVSSIERSLRFTFMEELMDRARDRDSSAVSDVIYDMIAAGLSPGPRSFHGLIVSQCLSGDVEGPMQSLRRELSAGLRPLQETFVALIRLYGCKGLATRGLEILAAMEKFKFDIRKAWLVLVDTWVFSFNTLFSFV